MTNIFADNLSDILILEGEHVRLQPLKNEHCDELAEAAADGELWNLNFTIIPRRDEMKAYVEEALKNRRELTQMPFIVRARSSNRIVGCTRYYNILAMHRNLSIGYTWYSKSVQRTAVNTETKLLLLSHAFEKLKCISVAFHTDDQNTKSQEAITRLGATKEGVLRNDRIMPDGRIRHTWCYSIIDSEWPAVKSALAQRLQQN